MHTSIHADSDQAAHDDQALIGTVNLKPHQVSRLTLGMYEDGIPMPDFHIEYQPADAAPTIDAALLRREEFGDYVLLYQFENQGHDACTVTVRSYSTL